MAADGHDALQSGEIADDVVGSRPLIAMSLLVFVGVLGLGVGIGVLATGSSITGGREASAQAAVRELASLNAGAEPAVEVAGATLDTIVIPTTPPASISGPTIADTVVPTTASPSTRVGPTTATTVPIASAPLTSLSISDQDERASEVEFTVLPKAVTDRFELDLGDVIVQNISSNDKFGGSLESVRLTGKGVLAPGFTLDALGTLSGTARECGNWRAQYELVSTNPATGTSWIELEVGGCANAG